MESKAVAGGIIDCYIARQTNGRKKVEWKTQNGKRKQIQHFAHWRAVEYFPLYPSSCKLGKKQESTLAPCDSGASLSFIDKKLADKLNAHGEKVDLNVAGIHGTNEVKCERLTVGIRGKARSNTHHMTIYTHPNIDAGSKIYDYRELKHAYPHFSVLSEETLKLKDVKMILGQNCYNIHRI